MTHRLALLGSAACLLMATDLAAAPLSDAQQAWLDAAITAYEPRMTEVAQTIWANPELGYLETGTVALLSGELEANGFTVETGIAGLPTGFVASKGTGDGPVIAILAEMDALPGFSQDAVPYQQAVEGITAGHACGHHLFGAGSVAAAIAVAQWLEDEGIPGQVRLYGTPAEEGGSGKVYMAREGVFDDVDVALHWHPASSNSASQGWSLSNVSAKIRFYGQSAHAALAPEQGRSALDGLEATTHMVNMLREHVPQDTRIHYVISNGGSAPNVVPDFAELYLYVRHQDPRIVGEVFDRVEQAAMGGAMGTGTRVEIERMSGVYSVLPNDVLGQVMDSNLRAQPAISWTEDETAFATELAETLRAPGDFASVGTVDAYEFGDVGFYSTDVGDVSWIVPTVGLGTATYVQGTPAHSWQAVAAGGMSIGHKGTALAARTLAATAIELFQSPEVLEAAKAEFDAARGDAFSYEALIGDRLPPLDYRAPAAQ
ncbi:amidohydrolase [Ketogulonicigenium robustum]|nr:amidohydrolase [Ketogulonicigenium robustum]